MGSDSSDYQEDTDSICTDPAYVTTHTRKRKKNTSESSKKVYKCHLLIFVLN